MTIAASELSLVLSGGSSNADSSNSLGGDPSAYAVNSNLFDKVTKDQSLVGLTDYRCIYIANDNATDTLYNLSAYIDNNVEGGATVSIGTLFRNDIQQITISSISSLTGGSITLLYDSESVQFAYSSTPTTWASNLQTALRAVTNLEDVTVNVDIFENSILFQINFIDDAGNRYHPLLTVSANELTPSSNSTITITKILDGAPLNAVADEIGADTTAPNSVTFSQPISSSPLVIGDLRALETAYVWIKRTVLPGTDPLENDGFSLRFKGDPLSS